MKLSYLLILPTITSVQAFSVPISYRKGQPLSLPASTTGDGVGILETPSLLSEEDDLSTLSIFEVKDRLLHLLPRMKGGSEEFKLVETYVNILEDKYYPPQTLDFLNLAMGGDWQLLFSTNLRRGPKPNFRLRELFQRVEPNKLNGTVTNIAIWDFAEDGVTFDATGTFSVKCSYSIHQGARMSMKVDDHIIEPFRNSKIPKDVPSLVGLLHRAMPTELFDPNDHAMDTTYLDGDVRIIRMTGTQFEGVRDIFIRRDSIDIHPI